MLWTPNQARRLRSDDHWLICFTNKAILLLALLLSLPALATNEWTYNEYWGISGWRQMPNLLTGTLQIVKTGDNVRISFPNGGPIPTNDFSVVLQTTTNLALEGEWTTVTNKATTIPYSGINTVTLPAEDPQRFFRFVLTETNRFPVFEFAIFHAGQLEFTQTSSLQIRGRTHANGPICIGAASGKTLKFDQTITTASSIVVSNMGGYSNFATTVYAGTPAYRTNTPELNLFGVASNRTIIELPPAGESPSSLQGQQRYYNKAALLLLVSNSTITLNVKNLGADAATGIISNYNYSSYSNIYFPSAPGIFAERTNLLKNLPFLSLTNRFYDYRESKWVIPTEINMAILKTWLVTNSMMTNKFPRNAGIYPNIMYVGDFRTITNLHALRLTAGIVIPTNAPLTGTNAGRATGFTVATINPMYIWGHYNCPNQAYLGTTNTAGSFPASLICDALTVLSTNWTDSIYGSASTALNTRTAADTTINAAIIAGAVYTTGAGVGNWSGGIQNLPRLLESWTSKTLTLNTSLVNLYPSTLATNQFQNPGVYYNAPTRSINFNQNFNDPAKLPPGTPTVVTFTPIQ